MWKYFVGSIVCIIVAVAGAQLSSVRAAERSQPFRIGALTPSWGPPPQVVGLRDGLLHLGHRENEDFVLGVRFTQGDLKDLRAAAGQLVQYGVDLIFTHRNDAARAAQRATTQIPIVFTGVNDPIGLQLIQSFAQPGGNITGVTDLEVDLAPKRLQLFREMFPRLRRVLYLYDAHDTFSVAAAKVYREAARRLGLVLVERGVQSQEEAQATLAQIRPDAVDGILRPASPSLNIPGFILEIAAQQRIPTMFNTVFWVEQGALAAYGPDEYESGRQAARLVDKIIKGAKPSEIPVEVNSKIEFAINLKTAKALGLTIPPEVLYRADRLIR